MSLKTESPDPFILDARCKRLVEELDPNRMPRHIAVIMDGNGRWAQQRHLPRVAGHRAGIDAVRDTVEMSRFLNIEALTLYAFSMENWKRPKTEISVLMRLLREFLHKELARLKRNNIRFQVLGRMDELPPLVQKDLMYGREETRKNTGMIFNVALNYGGRAELVDAFKRVAIRMRTNGSDLDHLSEADIERELYTAGLPDPDLLIRTSGEMRVSNFLLWQIAYSEIWVTPVLWPDFRRYHLLEGIIEFQKRERRYGGLHA
ncbi:MAG: isoprenyl transferase [Terriglobia bacterium]